VDKVNVDELSRSLLMVTYNGLFFIQLWKMVSCVLFICLFYQASEEAKQNKVERSEVVIVMT
jgi:hypothetical protein